MILRIQSAIALILCSCLISSTSSAASASIGLVTTTGSIQVDGLEVPGTSVIFAGNLISSGERSANLQFADGTSAVMRPGATVAVYHERSVVQHGVAMQRGIDQHPVLLANGLKISGATPKAVALVGVKDEMHFEVQAQEGESDVWTPSGALVARIEPGTTLSFSIAQDTGNEEKQKRGKLWWIGGIPVLIFIAIGGTLIGLAAAGSFGVTQPPVTPAAP
jgi:hypothetical protein